MQMRGVRACDWRLYLGMRRMFLCGKLPVMAATFGIIFAIQHHCWSTPPRIAISVLLYHIFCPTPPFPLPPVGRSINCP